MEMRTYYDSFRGRSFQVPTDIDDAKHALAVSVPILAALGDEKRKLDERKRRIAELWEQAAGRINALARSHYIKQIVVGGRLVTFTNAYPHTTAIDALTEEGENVADILQSRDINTPDTAKPVPARAEIMAWLKAA